MLRHDIESLLDRHRAAFLAHDAAALASHHLEDATFESPAHGRVQGRLAIERVYRFWFAAFPDMTFTWRAPIVDGSDVALFWSFSGTVQGPFFGIPVPGSRIEMVGAAHYTLRDGKIASTVHVFDFSAALMKAGVLKAKPA